MVRKLILNVATVGSFPSSPWNFNTVCDLHSLRVRLSLVEFHNSVSNAPVFWKTVSNERARMTRPRHFQPTFPMSLRPLLPQVPQSRVSFLLRSTRWLPCMCKYCFFFANQCQCCFGREDMWCHFVFLKNDIINTSGGAQHKLKGRAKLLS